MNTSFSADVAATSSLCQGATDVAADAARRTAAAVAAFELDAPSAESEAWRYGPINELDLDAYVPQLTAPTDPVLPETPAIEGAAATVTIVDGWITSIDLDADWVDKGLTVAQGDPSGRTSLDADDVDRIDRLHEAFAPAPLQITVKRSLTVDAPIVIHNHHSGAGVAAFPHVVVEAAANAEVTVVEHQTSGEGAGLAVPLVEMRADDAARLRYVTVQELDTAMWQLGRQISSAGSQASLVSGIAAFGGAYARVRTDTRLAGRGASGDLISVYYADGDQVHDFRTFQHHDAPDTLSDLLFKGTVDDRAGSIYTGLIHIHEDGRGSNAHQTNRNIKLSEDAWAWSVPNLEIENNDVRCSHASTVSPVDTDQRFYLHARGVPPTVADRLIVAGFFREVIARFPSPALQETVRGLVDTKLDRRLVAETNGNVA